VSGVGKPISREAALLTSRASAGTGPTRQRLIEVAIELFKQHSVAGTSLQMISDALGLTKSRSTTTSAPATNC